MADKTDSEPTGKTHIGAQLIIPVAALAFTLYYFSTIINSPWTAQVSAFFIGSVLILLIVTYLVKWAILVKQGKADLGMDDLVEPRAFIPKRLGLLALTLGFIFFVQWGGFTLTAFVFLSLAMLILSGGRRAKLIVSLAAALAIGGYLLFILAFDTRFPVGPFEQMMEPVQKQFMDRSL
jgi:hypothetical protein